MKISVSIPDAEVALLDAYARTAGLPSRSAAVQHAIRLLQLRDLEDDYAAAWDEWHASGEEGVWQTTAADGLGDAPR